jgi:hypothetical protein
MTGMQKVLKAGGFGFCGCCWLMSCVLDFAGSGGVKFLRNIYDTFLPSWHLLSRDFIAVASFFGAHFDYFRVSKNVTTK